MATHSIGQIDIAIDKMLQAAKTLKIPLMVKSPTR